MAVSQHIDRDIATLTTTLELMASYQQLRDGRLGDFHAQASPSSTATAQCALCRARRSAAAQHAPSVGQPAAARTAAGHRRTGAGIGESRGFGRHFRGRRQASGLRHYRAGHARMATCLVSAALHRARSVWLEFCAASYRKDGRASSSMTRAASWPAHPSPDDADFRLCESRIRRSPGPERKAYSGDRKMRPRRFSAQLPAARLRTGPSPYGRPSRGSNRPSPCLGAVCDLGPGHDHPVGDVGDGFRPHCCQAHSRRSKWRPRGAPRGETPELIKSPVREVNRVSTALAASGRRTRDPAGTGCPLRSTGRLLERGDDRAVAIRHHRKLEPRRRGPVRLQGGGGERSAGRYPRASGEEGWQR